MMNLSLEGVAALDREADLPLYVQLREALRQEIHRRGLKPGNRLPTEDELERRYGVSRSTIRQAMGDLAAEGVIRKFQGRGTFVGIPKIQHTPVLASFSELLRSQGYTPSHRLLESAVAAAPESVAQGLERPAGASCRYLRRLFFADGEAVGVAETWLPKDVLGPHDRLLEGAAVGDRSLYELLEAEPLGLVLHDAIETVNPGQAGEADAALLGCEQGSPLLLIHRTTRGPDGRPVEWTRLLFVGGRYEYRVELRRPADRAPFVSAGRATSAALERRT